MDIIIMSIVSICLPRCYSCVYSLSSAANEGKALAMTTGFSINLIRICIHLFSAKNYYAPLHFFNWGFIFYIIPLLFLSAYQALEIMPMVTYTITPAVFFCTNNYTEYSIIVLAYLTKILEGGGKQLKIPQSCICFLSVLRLLWYFFFLKGNSVLLFVLPPNPPSPIV